MNSRGLFLSQPFCDAESPMYFPTKCLCSMNESAIKLDVLPIAGSDLSSCMRNESLLYFLASGSGKGLHNRTNLGYTQC